MQCSVCLGAVTDAAKTACNHVFCKECLLCSLQSTGGTCPMCRRMVDRFAMAATAESVAVVRLHPTGGAAARPLALRELPQHQRARRALLATWPLVPFLVLLWIVMAGGAAETAENVSSCFIPSFGSHGAAACVYNGAQPEWLRGMCRAVRSCAVPSAICFYDDGDVPTALPGACAVPETPLPMP